ncbi:MAG: hypothetical protein M3P34_11450, partial [Actinomycetota bacterium]|nr:hypothetical protein [Actinomycetota bacterium]
STPVHVEPAPVAPGRFEVAVVTPPGEWCFWVVAEDGDGNRSQPSAMLRGISLRGAPAPPVWQSANRAGGNVELVWSHGEDQRLASLVERRPSGGPIWSAISPWLPRGQYQYTDTPPDVAAAWDYRLRVRDHLGQVAAERPVTQLPAD